MKTILVPTDFSNGARNALDYAIQLFGEDNKFILMNSYDDPKGATSSMITLRDVLSEASEDSLKEELDYLTIERGKSNLNLVTKSVYGDAVTAISSTATKEEAEVIVMGTTGASGLKEVLLGSVASGVVQKAKCPVVTVPLDAKPKKLQNILFASDLRAIKDSQLPSIFLNLCENEGSKMTILTVGSDDDVMEEIKAERGYDMHVQLDKIDHEFEVVEGDNVETTIADYATENEMDMVVTIPRKSSWFSQLFSPSVSKKLAQHLDVPMMALYLE